MGSISKKVVAVFYEFPVTTQTFHYRRLRVFHEHNALLAVCFVKKDIGRVESRNVVVSSYATRITTGRILTSLHLVLRPSVAGPLALGLRLANSNNGERGKLGFLWQAVCGLAIGRRFRRDDGVVFHSMFSAAPATVTLFAALAARKPWSVEVHAPRSLRTNPEFLAFKLSRADFVFPISSYMKSAVNELCEVCREEVIHCGIDLEGDEPDSTQIGSLHNPPVVLAVGRLAQSKGHDVLIRASAVLREDTDHILRIIGDGPCHDSLGQLARDLGVEVEFLGEVPPDDVSHILAEADVFVLASRYSTDGTVDGIPVALMEAMARGVPVVSTRVAGIPELLDDGKAGLLCEENDVSAIADAMRRLIRQPALRIEMATRARQRINQEFMNETESSRVISAINLVG